MFSLYGFVKGLLVRDETDSTKELTLEIDSGATTGTRTTVKAAQTADRTLTLPNATDTLVGKATTDILTNKTFDADGTGNVLSNIEDGNIKALAGIDATKIADGSISNTEYQRLNGLTGDIQTQLDTKVTGPASATDNALVRFDGTTGKLAQNSVVTVSDVGVATGFTQLDVDNVRLDGNTVSATSGDLILNGVDIDASSNIIKNVVDPVNPQDAATKNYVDSSVASTEFSDATFRIKDDSDATKKLAFEVSGISTATTRTWTIPDTNLNLSTSTLGTFATNTLSNLGTTTANNHILPASQDTYDLGGVTSNAWRSGYFATSVGVYNGVNPQLEITDSAFIVPSGGSVTAVMKATPTQSFAIYSSSSGSSSGNVLIESGNAAGGNSGNISLQAGTATGTRGSISLNGLAINANSSKINNVTDPTAAQDAATKNYTDTNFIAKSIVDAKGDLISATADNTPARLAVGTDGLFLKADSGAAVGLSWAAPAGTEAYRSITSTDTLSSSTDGIAVLSGASFTLNLPTAVGNQGKTFTIKHNGTSLTQVYTIDGSGAQTIDGSITYSLYTNGETIKIVSDNANWHVIEHKCNTGWTNAGTTTITSTGGGVSKGTATIVRDVVWWRRVGSNAEVRMTFWKSATGTATSGTGDYKFGMPSNMTIDIAALNADTQVLGAGATPRENIVGVAGFGSSTVNGGSGWVSVYDSTNVQAQGLFTSGSAEVTGVVGQSFFPLAATAIIYHELNFSVPISGWNP